jgi:hypothetical protein
MKRRRQDLAPAEQYEGMAGGGETVATVGEGAVKPRLIRRGKRSMYTGKLCADSNLNKLAAIGNIVKGIVHKGYNPGARRQFGNPHTVKTPTKLPAQIKDKTLFPDDPAKPTKSLSGGSGVKGSGLYEQKYKQLLPKLKAYNTNLKAAHITVNEIIDELYEHNVDNTKPSVRRMVEIKNHLNRVDKFVNESDTYLPDDDQMADSMPDEYSTELTDALNWADQVEIAINLARNGGRNLGIPGI